MPYVDAWDIERDARNWPGGNPIVAHPPCRAWGRLKAFAKPRPDEKDLARWSIAQIRKHGGVLEHPAHSSLWGDQNLPKGGEIDEYGGFTMHVNQFWWGHQAEKQTFLYVCGINRKDVPAIPYNMDEPLYVINSRRRWRKKPEIPKADRERTPPAFADWLCELARKCKQQPSRDSAVSTIVSRQGEAGEGK